MHTILNFCYGWSGGTGTGTYRCRSYLLTLFRCLSWLEGS